jgi:hypothetical protein
MDDERYGLWFDGDGGKVPPHWLLGEDGATTWSGSKEEADHTQGIFGGKIIPLPKQENATVNWQRMTARQTWDALRFPPKVAGPWEPGDGGDMDVRRAPDSTIVATTLWVTPKHPVAPWRVPVRTSDRDGADLILREHDDVVDVAERQAAVGGRVEHFTHAPDDTEDVAMPDEITDLERDVLTQMWRAQASGYGSQPHTPETEALFATLVERGWVAIERVGAVDGEEDFWFVTWAGLRAVGLEGQAVPSA